MTRTIDDRSNICKLPVMTVLTRTDVGNGTSMERRWNVNISCSLWVSQRPREPLRDLVARTIIHGRHYRPHFLPRRRLRRHSPPVLLATPLPLSHPAPRSRPRRCRRPSLRFPLDALLFPFGRRLHLNTAELRAIIKIDLPYAPTWRWRERRSLGHA